MMSYAFFDVDGTLLNFTSMSEFHRYAEAQGIFKKTFMSTIYKVLLKQGKILIPRNILNKIYYRQFQGCAANDIRNTAESWFEQLLCTDSNSIWNNKVVDRLHWHQSENHRVILVSGSFPACLAPIARHLGVSDILCVSPTIYNGIYTGAISPPQTIGEGKAVAIRSYLARQTNNTSASIWAYGDHYSDIPMLQLANNPVVVSGDSRLEAHAQSTGWARI